MDVQVELYFGVLSDSLSEQLNKQNFKFDKEKIKFFENDCDAINQLKMRMLLTDSQIDIITKKLYKKIINHISEFNNLSILRIKK